MQTIGSKLNDTKGIGGGFDFLRVLLSCSVVAWHEVPIIHGDSGSEPDFFWFWGGYAILAAFFGLSGFLITGSALRLTLPNFLINRGLRILPALAVEIALSAFVLGPIFTVLPLADYFSHPQTYHYLTNIIGLMNYQLPGVFVGNPSNLVNWALWTVPHEIGCYIAMSMLVLFGLLRRPAAVVAATLFCIVMGFVGWELSPYIGWKPVRDVIFHLFLWGGARLYVCFLIGIALYLYRDRVPYDGRVFALCAAYLTVLACLGPSPLLVAHKVLNTIAALPLMYMVVFLGVSKIPPLPVFDRGDYSYGIYLYGLPIQQSVRATFPTLLNPWLHALIAVPLIVFVAGLSWHLIEKPILGMRKRFSFVARVRGVT